MQNIEEYNDILNKIHEHDLQFLGLIDMTREDALDKLSKLKFSTYNALRASVNYHANKPHRNLDISTPRSIIRTQPISVAPTEPDDTSTRNTSPTPPSNTYQRVLDPETDANEIDPKYLSIRAEYLNELRALENSPGCSNCQRGKLRRRFIEKLIILDKANSES